MIVPLLLLMGEVSWMVSDHHPFAHHTQAAVARIAEALRLTDPGDYLMDAKGDNIFRPRPYYYVLETLTRQRLQRGLLPDDLSQHLIQTRTAVVDESPRMTPAALRFVRENYIPISRGFAVTHLAALGRTLSNPVAGEVSFEIVIPERYSCVGPNGPVTGILDGTVWNCPRWLTAGSHVFQPAAENHPLSVIWARALERGFSPFPKVKLAKGK
jgi:hypothetical protein